MIQRGILIAVLKEKNIKVNSKKSAFTMIAVYPNITKVPSSQGSGKTCVVLPSWVLCFSTYQKTTASRKLQFQKTVIFEKKRIGWLIR